MSLSLFLLGVDSIINTLIFSGIHFGDVFKWQCYWGVVATVLG